jgi:hypothetical protein
MRSCPSFIAFLRRVLFAPAGSQKCSSRARRVIRQGTFTPRMCTTKLADFPFAETLTSPAREAFIVCRCRLYLTASMSGFSDGIGSVVRESCFLNYRFRSSSEVVHYPWMSTQALAQPNPANWASLLVSNMPRTPDASTNLLSRVTVPPAAYRSV